MDQRIPSDTNRSLAHGYRLLRTRAANYWRLGRRILHDSIWRFRRRLGVLVAASGAALAAQAGALALFVVYARALESRSTIEIFGTSIDPTGSYLTLAVAICAAGALLVAASFLRLWVDRGFFEIGSEYGAYCAERPIRLASEALHAGGSTDAALDRAELKRLTIGGGRVSGRALYALMGMLPLIGGLIVYGAFLVYLDPLLTGLMLALLLVSSFFFYGLSVQAARLMAARQARGRELSDVYAGLVDYIRSTPPRPAGETGYVERTLSTDTFARSFAEFFRTRIVNARSTHVGTLTQAVVLTAVCLVKGIEIISTGAGFGDLVVFLVAGRLAMGAFQGLAGSLVMVNRFYPVMVDYFALIERLEAARAAADATGTAKLGQPLLLAAKPLGESPPQKAPVIEAGQRVGLVLSGKADRFVLQTVARGLRGLKGGQGTPGRLSAAACWLVPDTVFAGPVSFAEAAGLPAGVDRPALLAELMVLGVEHSAAESLPDVLEAPMTGADRDRLHPVAFLGAGIVAAARSARPVVVMNFTTLQELGLDTGATALDGLWSDRIVIVAARPRQCARLGEIGAPYTLVHDGHALLGYLSADEIVAKPELVERLATARERSASIEADDDMADEA